MSVKLPSSVAGEATWVACPDDRSMTAGTAEPQFDLHQIALEGYAYFYPLLTMEMTRRQMTNSPLGQAVGRGPMNTFVHVRQFPTADFRDVVRPNFDTLYSPAWLDLNDGPVIVSTPDTDGRYYLLPMYDMWTDAFAAPGWRTSGTGAAAWGIVPPGWTGTLPEGISAIEAPTSTIWIIGRTQTNGPADYEAVNQLQDGFAVTPLSRWGEPAQPVTGKIDPTVDMHTEPLRQVNALPAVAYFSLAAELMKTYPPHLTDWSILARLRHLGIVAGESFDPASQSDEVAKALDGVPAEAQQHMMALLPTMARVANGWSMNTDTIGVYGNYYLKRAIVAMAGLGANSVEDAIYPLQMTDADGNATDGSSRYVLHFDAGQQPPVDAFWSVTMYDQEGFQIANPIDRFAIGDRDALQPGQDGSLDIFVQHTSPGADKESNWLPAPTGPFGLCLRLYAPRPEALDGRWNPPPLRRLP
jgi:hypothetical protein